ncbi:MAG: SBBP repeat-containing protein [bacterium]|nr:SBBP repeat-containing protein [bacterium]
MVYSTYLGGSNDEEGYSIAVDTNGNVYITGYTISSIDFPTTSGAFDTSYNSSKDVFVTKLNATGSALIYSTLLGGSGIDWGYGIAVDTAGNAYITGWTLSGDFPITSSALDTTYNGGYNAFVTKLNASGSALLYSTFLGGSSMGFGIAIDIAGNAYITGDIGSSDFPITSSAFDTTYNGGYDVFVTKINSSGSGLDYSTFLGGSSNDQTYRNIVVDTTGNAYIAGHTVSADFPTTPGAFDTTYNVSDDVFVSKLNSTGTNLIYSTFIGGSGVDFPDGIALDNAGNIYIGGWTRSADFPTTPGAFDTTHNGGTDDIFVCKLDPSLSTLIYSTFLGGSAPDDLHGISVDSIGNAFVTGNTSSSDYPITTNALNTTLIGGACDVFLTKLNASGAAIIYSTFFGGSGEDVTLAIDQDSTGSIYITGYTQSTDFLTTGGAFDTTYNGSIDIFVSKFSFPPYIEKAIYSDINNNLSVDSGDKVTIQFDKRMKVTSATTADFYLPVTGDKLGTGATIAVNSFNDTQVVITLGICSLRIDGVFNSNTTSAGSPSGIDISASMVANHIENLDGLDAQPSGIKDILYTLSSATVYVIAYSAATVQVSQDTINDYYLQHKLIIPKDSLATSTTITAGLPGDTHGALSAVSFGPPGITFSSATPSTLIIEYKDGDIRHELGYMENALRIHQWKTPDSTWVMLPETYSSQSVDTTNRTVSVKIDKFNMVGTAENFAFAGSNTTIVYANIDLPTVDATSTVVTSSKSFFANATTYLTVGTTGIYTKHRLTLSDYTVSYSGVTIALLQPTYQEKHGWLNYAALKIVTQGIITTTAKLTMEYKDSNDTVYNQYRNDVSGGNEQQMRVYHWNESLLQWEQLTTQWPSEVNAVNNTITASLPANQLTGTQIYALKVDPVAVPVELSRFEAILPKD